jgi:YggT family protein
MILLLRIIHLTATVLTWVVIIDVVLTYFMSPFHPIRQTLDRLVEPLLMPIRRVMPNTGMIDFSPIVLLIAIQLVEYVLTRLLLSL